MHCGQQVENMRGFTDIVQRVLTRSLHQLCICLFCIHTTTAAVAPLPTSLETPATQSRSQISVFFLFHMLLHFHQEYRIYPQNIYIWRSLCFLTCNIPLCSVPLRVPLPQSSPVAPSSLVEPSLSVASSPQATSEVLYISSFVCFHCNMFLCLIISNISFNISICFLPLLYTPT